MAPHRLTENDQQEERCKRSFLQPVDWSKCVFCEKFKHKGNTNLSEILTCTAEHNLKEGAKVRSDYQMLRKINGVVQELKYHASCFSAYTSKKIWINLGVMTMIPSQDTLKPFQNLYKN